MNAEIYPGILTHNLEEYVTRLEQVETSDTKWAHIDFADGQFVPNITVMPHEIESIATTLNMEAHLMTYMPERYFSDLTVARFKRVLIHRESFETFEECSKVIHDASNYFEEVGLVLNPDTKVENYSSLPITTVQCMGVQPGFSGQAFLEETYAIIKKIREQKLPVTLAVDGGVSEDNIKSLQHAGVSRFVISSHIFMSNTVPQNVNHFIQLVSGGI